MKLTLSSEEFWACMTELVRLTGGKIVSYETFYYSGHQDQFFDGVLTMDNPGSVVTSQTRSYDDLIDFGMQFSGHFLDKARHKRSDLFYLVANRTADFYFFSVGDFTYNFSCAKECIESCSSQLLTPTQLLTFSVEDLINHARSKS